MKRKIFDLLSASIATMGLLATIPNALNNSLEFSTPLEEICSVEWQPKSSGAIAQAKTQYQKLVNQDRASKSQLFLPLAVASSATQPDQSNVADLSQGVTKILAGLFITSLFFGYIFLRLQYKKHRTSHAAILLQKIEALEKNWNVPSNKELETIYLKEKIEILERIWKMPPQQRQKPSNE